MDSGKNYRGQETSAPFPVSLANVPQWHFTSGNHTCFRDREIEAQLFQETRQRSVTAPNETTAAVLLSQSIGAGWLGEGLPCSHCRDPMHGASSKKPSAWVGSLPCLREPCGTRDAETIASVVPELALSERVPPRRARSVIRLPAGHWKMDVLFIFVQAVNSTAIWLHEFTSLAAE